MYDFKTFAQANVDLIFKDFDRLPQPGEEVFARQFTLQLGGGPSVCPMVLEKLGFRVRLGIFLGQSTVSGLHLYIYRESRFYLFFCHRAKT